MPVWAVRSLSFAVWPRATVDKDACGLGPTTACFALPRRYSAQLAAVCRSRLVHMAASLRVGACRAHGGTQGGWAGLRQANAWNSGMRVSIQGLMLCLVLLPRAADASCAAATLPPAGSSGAAHHARHGALRLLLQTTVCVLSSRLDVKFAAPAWPRGWQAAKGVLRTCTSPVVRVPGLQVISHV